MLLLAAHESASDQTFAPISVPLNACVAGKICLMFLQLTRYLICKISQVDIKYTNKKKSGSAIL